MSRWMPVHALYPSAAVDLLCCPTYTFPLNRLPRDRRVRMYFSLFKFLAGGHDVARTGAEGCAGVSGIALFGCVYPIVMYLWRPGNESPGDAMMLSLYVTLGVFLLSAARNPSANRSLIAFTAWSSFAHGAVMAVLAFQIASERRDLLIAVAVLAFIGVALIVLAPGRPSGERLSAAGA